VISQSSSAVELYGEDPLAPKFKYIKALSVGALQGKEEMKTELDSLIAQHPGTEESAEASEIIEYMYVEFPEIKEAAQAQEAEALYTAYDPEQEHHVMIALHSSENVNQVSFDLLNFNLDNFNQYDLNIERIELTDSYNLLVIKTFTNADAASRYLQVIKENSEQILTGINTNQYRMMLVSLDNFVILSQEKQFNPYYLFYLKYYLDQE
jgi:hypothetical protein